MVWCTQLRCQRLTLAAFSCQSIMYVCSQRRLLDTGQQRVQPITERVMRLCFGVVPGTKQSPPFMSLCVHALPVVNAELFYKRRVYSLACESNGGVDGR